MALINRGHMMLDYLRRLGTKDTYKAKFEALMAAVDNAEVIDDDLDVQPVVHAFWHGLRIGDKGAYFCSECGFTNIFKGNYCTKCGAKMDGDPHDSGQ